MLELKGISKKYGNTYAVHPTDIRIERGKTTVLLGPSGCGKSTLLRLMMGLIPSSEGTIRFDGTELNPQNVLQKRREMGYVIQDGGLFPHLTARENVLLMPRFLKRPEEEISQRLNKLADLTKLSHGLLDKYPSQLSGGQKQRISLIRALILDAKVLLLDEPMGALDPMIRADLQADLKSIFEELDKTVILVTHDLNEAYFLGHSVALMQSGKILQRGAFDDLLKNPANDFVENFVLAQRSVVPSRGEDTK